jgi:hypothetical protein
MSFADEVRRLQELIPKARAEVERAVLAEPNVFATHSRGTWLVQSLIENGGDVFHASLAEGLDLFRCLTCPNGNYVLQSLVNYARFQVIERPIVRPLAECTTPYYATHVAGCRIYCRLLEHCAHLDGAWRLVSRVMSQLECLVHSRYGHYVVQKLLEHGPVECVEDVLDYVASDLDACLRDRDAIFVVLECLQRGASAPRARLEARLTESESRLELLRTTPARFQALLLLARSSDEAVRHAAERSLARGGPGRGLSKRDKQAARLERRRELRGDFRRGFEQRGEE